MLDEPDWDLVDEQFNRPPVKDDIVWVKKKTRGRFGKMAVAQPGDHGIVIGSWVSSMGSHKVSIVTSTMQELATTASCVKVFGKTSEVKAWQKIKGSWMDETYIPIIIIREMREPRKIKKKNRKRTKTPPAHKHNWVVTRDGCAVLVKPMGSDVQLWLSSDKVHPEDWQQMLSDNTKRCHSVRVPEWIAIKAGIY